MKILMISSFLPYPLTSGGHIRLYNLLKNLSKKYEVTLVCEKRDSQKDAEIKEVQKICKEVITVARRKQWTISNILKAAFSLDSFLVVGHTNSEMKDKIKDSLKNNFDLIHVETFYVMQNLPNTKIPVVLVEHNIEYSIYDKFVNSSLFFLKPFLKWDVLKMKIRERRFWKSANLLVAVSEKEKKIMNADYVVPNGVDTKVYKPYLEGKDKRVLFIGDFKWLENRDSVRLILKEIWPKLRTKISKAKLWIVGRNIPQSIINISKDPNVIFEENLPDASQIYKKAFILLSPIRIGGGTSFKILEAMSSGIPVVTTNLGAEGITKGNEIVRADRVDDIIRAVSKLFDDRNFYQRISKSARNLIEKNYDWRPITRKLEKVYESAVKKND